MCGSRAREAKCYHGRRPTLHPIEEPSEEARMTATRDNLSRRSFLAGITGVAAMGRPRYAPSGQVVPTLALAPFLARPTTDSLLVSVRNGTTAVFRNCTLKVGLVNTKIPSGLRDARDEVASHPYGSSDRREVAVTGLPPWCEAFECRM